MGIIKKLKKDTTLSKILGGLSSFLDDNNLEIVTSLNGGIFIRYNDMYFKYTTEGIPTEVLPPQFDGVWVLCDEGGNTDFYQEEE